MLRDKEKEMLNSLPRGFNIVKENSNYNLMAFKRSDVSRFWAKKLLKISFFINILSISIMGASIVVALLKPSPQFYASTPSGKVIYLETISN